VLSEFGRREQAQDCGSGEGLLGARAQQELAQDGRGRGGRPTCNEYIRCLKAADVDNELRPGYAPAGKVVPLLSLDS
jgi:hypothetical protein